LKEIDLSDVSEGMLLACEKIVAEEFNYYLVINVSSDRRSARYGLLGHDTCVTIFGLESKKIFDMWSVNMSPSSLIKFWEVK
jgi:hypothetical protein